MMPQLTSEEMQKKKGLLGAMRSERDLWTPVWREIADYYLPRRYVWLMTKQDRAKKLVNNPKILDGTGTIAARILAAGMMSGITSPARPWFKLRIAGFDDDLNSEERIWLDEVQRRMMLIMAESNFYNAMAVLYLDLVLFGTAVVLVYEDRESVIRCYNPALGEFFISQSSRLEVNTFAREFVYTAAQCAEAFGKEYLSPSTKSAVQNGGAGTQNEVTITHLIEPSKEGNSFTEYFWENAALPGVVLAKNRFFEFPAIVVRWELTGNDSYGSSPAMDALGDVKQLQQETMEKGKSLNILNNPPLLADMQLQHRPSAFMPRGITYIAGLSQGNVGAKPVYQISPPLGEMTLDIKDVQFRIRETFNNDLFQMISQLDTVRTATEIDARREEKLIRLGSVYQRFQTEALDPVIKRIYAIMSRSGLLPVAPEGMSGADLEIQYDSIMTVAQSAIAAAPTERFAAFVGNLAAIYPKALNVPNWDSLIRDYGRDIGVPAKNILPVEETARVNAQQDAMLAEQQAANTGSVLVDSAKNLSETEVGGGENALQRLLG